MISAGKLWVGQYRSRQIICIDPDTGSIIKTLESDRFVTGVTWLDGELWHGTWEGDESELRRIDSDSADVITRLAMPEGQGISGLESDGAATSMSPSLGPECARASSDRPPRARCARRFCANSSLPDSGC